ncbi:MAG: hypothetical protein H0W63_10625 [Gemmatimonadaceae bacterium]|nr:hypothetical protein [Gemmatimonadaceae bacterium]
MVTVAILAVLGTVIVPAVESSSRLGGEAKRVDDAVSVLADIRDASVRYNLGDVGLYSFTLTLGYTAGGINPGKISHLTNKISVSDLNACGWPYTSTQVTRWQGAFYRGGAIASTTAMSTYQIAPGFVAEDTLQRYNQSGTVTRLLGTSGSPDLKAPGTLAIIMKNVALSDATALAARMEGDQSGGVNSIVRFSSTGRLPVTVFYHMEIHGC